jgi:glucokinase
MLTVGIDVGGTKIAGGVVNESGEILTSLKVPTPATNTAELIDAIVNMVEELRTDREIGAVGVAIAGFIDAAQSEVIYSPNLSLRNEPLKAELASRLGVEVVVENDANAAGWAEFRFGAGQGSAHMMMITIGTGVGGAIISNGNLFRGGFGIGAELGHINFIQDGKLCGCGQHGCFEKYASGSALLEAAKDLASAGTVEGSRLAELQAEVGILTGSEVYKAIEESDPGAIRLLNELGTNIGKAVASLAAVLDPQMLVIGGGLSVAGELLVGPVRDAYLAHLPARGFRPEMTIVTAALINDAGIVGVADLARMHSLER